MPNEIEGFLKTIYIAGFLLVFFLLAAAWVVRSRGRTIRKAWAPLRPMVKGAVRTHRKTSTLTGEYHGRPVVASISRGGQGTPNVFTVEMPAGPGGRDWEIAHRSEQFLGSEMWRAFTTDPALQRGLTAEGGPARFQAWPTQAQVRYDAARGTLTLREEILAPTAEHFREQLETLEWLVDVNRDING